MEDCQMQYEHRRWLPLSSKFSESSPDSAFASPTMDLQTISLMTYNILAQSLVRRSWFPYCSKDVLKFKFRRQNIIKEIAAHSPDIACLQEIDFFDEFYMPNMKKLGYAGVYGRISKKLHGCAIFYKRNKLQLLDVKTLYYDEEFRKRHLGICHTDNVAMLALFRLKDSHKTYPDHRLVIGTTHLYWKVSYSFVKLLQAKILFDAAYRLASQHDQRGVSRYHCPFIICGDFNTLPDHSLYKIITMQDTTNLDLSVFEPPIEATLHQVDKNMLISFFPQDSQFLNDIIKTPNGLSVTASDFSGNQSRPAYPHRDISISEETYQKWRMTATQIYREFSRRPPNYSVYGAYGMVDDLLVQKWPSHKIQQLNEHKIGEPPFTNVFETFQGTLDYIFYCNSNECYHHLQPTHLLELPTWQAVSSETALPNSVFSSDHICLMSQFRFVSHAPEVSSLSSFDA